WCRPCKVLDPLLEKLALEANGAFRLAKLNVDDNPNVVLRFHVRSLPTVKAFSEGEVVGELVGLQPETRIREFISRISPPSPITLALEKAESVLNAHQWREAEQMYRLILQQNPDMPAALLGLAKALLAQGQSHAGRDLLRSFPASRQYARAEQLLHLADVMILCQEGSLPNGNDLDATFCNSIRLAGRGKLNAAADGLLDILRQDRQYRDQLARQVMLSLLELMGEENEQTRQYRAELATILF
ncbi:MAG: tetratricopeptide repeat protein, partial [Anaerolineaceae bacterium]|nr:tetratricopeptide repeat protein [Anaerolineaceae bacterium]